MTVPYPASASFLAGLAFARSLAGADYFSKIKRERLVDGVVDGDGSHNNSTTNFEGEIT